MVFAVVVVVPRACLVVWGRCPWCCQSTCLRCSSASVAHVKCGMLVTAAACFLLLASFFKFASFVVDLDALVTGDLKHEFA